MLGVQTIGNATLIAYDGSPVLSTDPWMGGDHYAYFGSWCLPYQIPDNLKEDIVGSEYIWFSHGHPDHINQDSLPLFKKNKILVSEHFGSRISEDLRSENFDIHVLRDRQWAQLSKNVSIMPISTNNQDTILLVKIKDDIFINLNDAGLYSSLFIKRVASNFRRKFLLSLCSFEADMINFFDADNNFIEPAVARHYSPGEHLSILASSVGANHIIPFSTFHAYNREDSVWANKYIYPVDRICKDIDSKHTYIEPFTFINSSIQDDFRTLSLNRTFPTPKPPHLFGDNWTDELTVSDMRIVENYFSKFSSFNQKIGFISLLVGGKELNLKFGGPPLKGISFELPRNSLVEACQNDVFDDLLIGNFMKTKLYNLEDLYEPTANFTREVCKIGDNGRAYSEEDIKKYREFYAKRMGKEYFLEIFSEASKNTFKYLFKNYKNSKYYNKARKAYYYFLK